jgi:hypothetical protein
MSRRSPRALAAIMLVLAAACAHDRAPTAPDASPPDPAMSSHRLTIDVATGRITVAGPPGPASVAARGTMAKSLIGADAVEIQATNCTFSTIAGNSKQKRCAFELTLINKLEFTDLVTPTTFPRPPQGTTGILVFPYTAAALGVPGGSAVPSPDWDNAPRNFFNDFGSCSGGKTSDCYRWEEFDGPLYAGTTSEAHTVGFDVDKNAHSVRVDIVVAADLRENPRHTLTIAGEADRCGSVNSESGASLGKLVVTNNDDVVRMGFCSFVLPDLPADVEILSATLRAYQEAAASNFELNGPVEVDHLVYGLLDDDDLSVPALSSDFGTLSTTTTVEFKTLDVADQVLADISAGRSRSQFRLHFSQFAEVGGSAIYSATADPNPPQLVIVYRNP